MKVAVSGAMGRLGSVIAHGISSANDMQLTGVYAPGHVGKMMAGMDIEDSTKKINAQIIVECTGVIMENLKKWHAKGMSVVIGTLAHHCRRCRHRCSLTATGVKTAPRAKVRICSRFAKLYCHGVRFRRCEAVLSLVFSKRDAGYY